MKKGFLAVTALLEEKQKVAILPLYINRSSGDKDWAYRAEEQPTIALALKQLETQLDEEKSKLTQAIDFFSISPSDSDMTNRSAVSSFWFKV